MKKPTNGNSEKRVAGNECMTQSDMAILCKAFQESPDMIVITKKSDNTFLFANKRFFEISGFTKEELIGKTSLETNAWVELSARDEFLKLLKKNGELHAYKARMRMNNGAIYPFLLSSKTIELNNEDCIITVITNVEKLEKTEEKLRISEEKYRTLFDNAYDAIFMIDADQKISDCNKNALELLNGSEGEIIGKYITDFTPEYQNDGKTTAEHIRQIKKDIAEKQQVRFEWLHKRIDGEEFPAEISLKVVDSQNEQNLLAIIRDISERKEIEKNRDNYFKFLESIEKISSIMSKAEDLEQMLNDVLEEVLEIFQCDRAFFLYPNGPDVPYLEVPMEKTRKEYPGAFSRSVKIPKTQEIIKTHELLLDIDGPIVFDPVSGLEVPEESKKFLVKSQIGMMLYPKVDIPWLFSLHQCSHERIWTPEDIKLFQEIGRRLEDSLKSLIILRNLRESERKYRDLTDTIPITIFEIDNDGKILYANAHAFEKFEYSKDDFKKGLSILQMLSPEDRERAVENTKKGIHGIDFSEVEYTAMKKNGSKFPVLTYTRRMLQGNNTKGLRGFIIDISSRKQFEKEKKKLEEQLFQAQKMESIGRLAGGIAHDFNNILASILGYSEMLKLKFPDDDTTEGHAVDIILKSSERAADLTKQLLGFARKGKYNPVTLDINDVIRETVDVSEKIFEKKIDIFFNLFGDIKNVEADRGQVVQVLTNLFINARDAMPGGGKLIIESENVFISESEAKKYAQFNIGPYVRIKVIDTGIGMNNDIKEKIFEPFFSTKGEGEGTGLGLAMVYGIMKNHSGYIYVDSEIGKGTTFTLYFPVSDKDLHSVEESDVIIKGNETVLVIDDEEYVLTLTEQILKTLGYKVFVAKNGSDGIEIFKDNRKNVDLVLLDMIMPGLSGRDTFAKLKDIDPDVKVILSSGYSKDGQASKIMEDGVSGFIQKPFKMKSLSQSISKVLKNDLRK